LPKIKFGGYFWADEKGAAPKVQSLLATVKHRWQNQTIATI
jgi:hypothetical protein